MRARKGVVLQQTEASMFGGFYGLARRARLAAVRALAIAAAGVALPLHAQTITQAWERVFVAEPALEAARANHRAAGERRTQARATLLPQVEASVNGQKNRRSFIQDTVNPFTGEPSPEVSERYPSRTAQVNITQPIWRLGNWAALAQARASEEQAAWQARATEQDLQTRFVSAWFDVMGSRDNVLHGTEQVNATRQQLEVMRRGERLGTHSAVQAAEAQARHEQAIAELAAASAEHDAKLALLEQLTGPLPGFAAPFLRVAEAPRIIPAPEPLAVWLARAESESAAVRAGERALAVALEEVRRQQALHQPTLDLVARHARVLQGSGNAPGQSGYRSREHSVGLQLNVPLFAGGGTQAKVREAQALADKAQAELDTTRRGAIAQARQAWSAAQAAQARAQSADHGVRATELALQQAIGGQATGLRTAFDELQARQQLAAARRDQQRAHYDRVLALARLRQAGGQPAIDLLVQLEALLSPVDGAAAAASLTAR
jgi:outer membrane protein